MKKILTAAAVLAIAASLAACHSNSSSGPAVPAASVPAARISSAMAGPTASADINQAKQLVAKCISGTPVQQLHTLYLLFASKTGPNAQAGEQTRTKVFGCLGIPADQRTSFENAAFSDAEHAHLTTTGGRHTYFEVTLPQLVATYQAKS